MAIRGARMAVPIQISKFSANVEEVKLIEWQVREGEWIEKGDIIFVIETEKVSLEVEAEASGYLQILVEEGVKIAVGSVIGLLAETKQELSQLQKELHQKAFSSENKEKQKAFGKQSPILVGTESAEITEKGLGVLISPVARKLAKKHMIDIALIQGSGPGRRIVKKDIEVAIKAKEREIAGTDTTHGKRVKSSIPLKGMQESIAEHMYRSLSSSAQMTVMGELDMMEVVKLREGLLQQEAVMGLRISYVDIMIFIVARALKEHPAVNSSLIDGEIKIWEDLNIGVAVALDAGGLIVPVVKDAGKKSLAEIAEIRKDLIQKAQKGTLVPDEVTGGTFTLTSVGSQGESLFQTPILNQPQAAILATGPIADRPAVMDGKIAIRPIMPYSLTFDHRIINGFRVEQFMAEIRNFMGSPGTVLLVNSS